MPLIWLSIRMLKYFLPFALFIGLFNTIGYSQDNNENKENIIGIAAAVLPNVVIQRNDEDKPINISGVFILDQDDIIVDETGLACFSLTMLSSSNEICQLSNSRVQIRREVRSPTNTTFNIELLYGKILVKTEISSSISIKIITGSVEVINKDGEFIVDATNGATQVGTVKGLTLVDERNKDFHVSIPENEMVILYSGIQNPTTTQMSPALVSGVDIEEVKRLQEEKLRKIEKEKRIKKAERLRIVNEEKRRKETERIRKIEAEKKRKELAAAEKKRIEDKKRLAAEEKENVAKAALNKGVKEDKPGFFDNLVWSDYKWDGVAVGTLITSIWLSLEEAKKYNSLESDNSTIKSQYAAATTQTDRTNLNIEYEVNKEKMAQYLEQITLYNYVSYIAIIWESYLIYDRFYGSSNEEPEKAATSNTNWSFSVVNYSQMNHTQSGPFIRFEYRW